MYMDYFLGAAAAAVMSSSKVTTVLRPASQLPNAATAQPAVQHIIHQPIQASDSHAKLKSSSCSLFSNFFSGKLPRRLAVT